MNRTSRRPRAAIRLTWSRTLSTERCRNWAPNMNGVWQNLQV